MHVSTVELSEREQQLQGGKVEGQQRGQAHERRQARQLRSSIDADDREEPDWEREEEQRAELEEFLRAHGIYSRDIDLDSHHVHHRHAHGQPRNDHHWGALDNSGLGADFFGDGTGKPVASWTPSSS